jgi:hypothetical protein
MFLRNAIDRELIHYHLQCLEQKGFIIGQQEPNMQGINEYLTTKLDIKGKIYLKNPNNLETNEKAETIIMENDFKSILTLINETNCSSDYEIIDKLEMDLDTVRYYLEEMDNYKLIKLIKDCTFEGAFYNIVEVTPKGKMFLREKIKINDNSIPSQSNIYIQDNNYYEGDNKSNISQYHSGSGDNVGKNKNINNSIDNIQELNQTIIDIQNLLKKLEQTYNPNTTTGKMTIATKAIEYIEKDRNLTQRVISSLEKGGTAWLQAKLINPSASFLIAALENWRKTKQ